MSVQAQATPAATSPVGDADAHDGAANDILSAKLLAVEPPPSPTKQPQVGLAKVVCLALTPCNAERGIRFDIGAAAVPDCACQECDWTGQQEQGGHLTAVHCTWHAGVPVMGVWRVWLITWYRRCSPMRRRRVQCCRRCRSSRWSLFSTCQTSSQRSTMHGELVRAFNHIPSGFNDVADADA